MQQGNRKRRAHRALDLWMNGVRVGEWRPHAGGDELVYDEDWVRFPGGRPISRSLPFLPGNASHRGEKVRSYFDNLLPDNEDIRKRLAQRYKTGSVDPFDLLAEIGRDCVGALQLMPPGEASSGIGPVMAESLTEADVAAVLRNTVTPNLRGLMGDEADFRISIAGAQEKTALLCMDGRWHRPLGSTPTSHILKLPLGLIAGMRQIDMRYSVENEWLCSLILKEFGLPVAQCEPVVFEDVKALSVVRFDREWANVGLYETMIRLPQEDMCQALGFSPLEKYERDGGPGMDDILDLLDGSVDADIDKLNFFKAQVLFWMLCATDGHAKNFSIFLQPRGDYRLTPLYDVLSAYPVIGRKVNQLSPHGVRMAMAVRSINPHWKMREILRRHWEAVGQRHGIGVHGGAQVVGEVLDQLIAQTPLVVSKVAGLLPADFPGHVSEPIFEGLVSAAKKLECVQL